MPQPSALTDELAQAGDAASRLVEHHHTAAGLRSGRFGVRDRSAVRLVREELERLFGGPTSRRRLGALPLVGLATAVLIVAAAWVQRIHPGVGRLFFDEQASLGWSIAVLRLPGSLVAPAMRLPLWGALAQVLFCFGLAEARLGRRTTLLIIGLTHAVATASARVFVAIGPRAPFDAGLPQWVRWQRDTGPSAAVVGLGTYLGVTLRLPVLTSLLVGSMVVETLYLPDLADREHLVAIATGGAAAILVRAGQGVLAVRPRPVVDAIG